MERESVLAKKIEALIGLVLFSPVVVGIISFFYSLIMGGFDFEQKPWLDFNIWQVHYGDEAEGAAMSPTPIFYGLLAIAAVIILKDSMKYLFIKLPPKQ